MALLRDKARLALPLKPGLQSAQPASENYNLIGVNTLHYFRPKSIAA